MSYTLYRLRQAWGRIWGSELVHTMALVYAALGVATFALVVGFGLMAKGNATGGTAVLLSIPGAIVLLVHAGVR